MAAMMPMHRGEEWGSEVRILEWLGWAHTGGPIFASMIPEKAGIGLAPIQLLEFS